MTQKIFRLVTSLILALALTVITLAPQSARAAGPWYVSTTGNDSNDCLTQSTACATINGAIVKAAAGETINVAVGTYTSTGTVLIDKDITLSGGWDASFTAQSGMSTIDGQAARRGIDVSNGITAIIERFVVQNGSANGGGGIYNDGGTITLKESAVSENNATFGGGGGIANASGGVITISDSSVSGNTANIGGGIVNATSSILTINNSTISGNTANSRAGGIYNSEGTLFINNTTISGNSSTLFPGGAGINNEIASGSVVLKNSIIAGNINSSGPNCLGTINSLGYNLLGNNSGCTFSSTTGDQVGTSAAPIDPLLGTLQNNGGPTFTHALLPGSPAIDAGNPAGCTDQNGNPLTTDQRGVARPQGAACDIGAFELEATGGVNEVTIDIKPGSRSNPINPKSTGTTPVAILSTQDFNAPVEVDKASLTFGRTGDEASLSFCDKKGLDVNGDGLLDLVCHFKTKLTGFHIGDTVGVLKGKTVDGAAIQGSDVVKILK